MGKWLKRLGGMILISMIGVMLGVQWMSEQYGLSQPEPLQLADKGEKHSSKTTERKKESERPHVPQTEGVTNVVSELGQVTAKGSQSVVRSGLERIVGAIQKGLSKE
ncbi:hypothetical protein [Shouchella lonarensis]|uniref:Uncharacterized protein n=1 Tax=Shouchella lonarensis TaxID=1464122 RepID=A0A1G6KHU4_9BACI|nr:hypothetical protein [Shouchella lonarensis]SDC30497.1 hypothetical protein SAMN05421737_10736 [Shouchella lonarensis]